MKHSKKVYVFSLLLNVYLVQGAALNQLPATLYALPASLGSIAQDCCARVGVPLFPLESILCADFSSEHTFDALYRNNQTIILCRNRPYSLAKLRFLLCHELGHYKSFIVDNWHAVYKTEQEKYEDEKYAETQALLALNCQTCLKQALADRWELSWGHRYVLSDQQGFVSYDADFVQKLIQEHAMPLSCSWCENSAYQSWLHSLDQC
jgi:hypothetical protein